MYLEDRSKHPAVSDPLAAARECKGKLIALLRDRSRWPKGFSWDYGECRTCALGLLVAVGDLEIEEIEFGATCFFGEKVKSAARSISNKEACELTRRLALDPLDANRAFMTANHVVFADERTFLERVRPEHVAALLESAPYVL